MAPLILLDPTEGPYRTEGFLAPRVASLAGAAVGVIWNGRPNGDRFLRAVLRRLEARGCTVVEFLKKPYLGNVAPAEFFDTLRRRDVAFVIAGVGD
jgi:hypothetical protein